MVDFYLVDVTITELKQHIERNEMEKKITLIDDAAYELERMDRVIDQLEKLLNSGKIDRSSTLFIGQHNLYLKMINTRNAFIKENGVEETA